MCLSRSSNRGGSGYSISASLVSNPVLTVEGARAFLSQILVDLWTRDRRLGTIPLEIHILDYLRRDGVGHPNIVEMADFFENDDYYYIETTAWRLPTMDLFDYIELRSKMEEGECQHIFKQVAMAVHHLHTKALVVHRDIKDENIFIDDKCHVRLAGFGCAAYVRSGPFDCFVGTIGETLCCQREK